MGFGIYVHFPYCLSKCPYCDFASSALPVPHQRYARALIQEVKLRAREAAGRTALSIYFGGGTPSLWEKEPVFEVVRAIRDCFTFIDDPECTLEANPASSEARNTSHFKELRRIGFNRLSVGVQSFDESTLVRLGRRHTVDDALAAVGAARDAGFENLALDLIYGAPGQDVAMARTDAERLVELSPEHASCYALTLEHLAVDVPMAAAVRAGSVKVPDSDQQWEMGQAMGEVLAAAGLDRYEISNWARPRKRALHNTLYWTSGEYLGLGAGACGFLFADPNQPSRGGRRWSNHRDPERWFSDVEAGLLPEASNEPLDATTLFRESLAMGLRQVDGVDLEQLCLRFQQKDSLVFEVARTLEGKNLGSMCSGRFALTPLGLDHHSDVASAFF
jgi:putative oxygen-independent coproporphyrinogen III oxidase